MEFRVLGPLGLWDEGGEVSLSGPKAYLMTRASGVRECRPFDGGSGQGRRE
jgi:hypothetical protein